MNIQIIECQKIHLENSQSLTEHKLIISNLENKLKNSYQNYEQTGIKYDSLKKDFYQEKITYDLQINDLKIQVIYFIFNLLNF